MAKRPPYVAMDPRWWASIAAALPKGEPWPDEAVWMDLRWWADQEAGNRKIAGKPVKRPGRPGLQKRWGWEEWRVRAVLKNEEAWGDPYRASLQPASSGTPVSHQPASSRPPEIATQAPDSASAGSRSTPAGLQPASSRPPAALPTRVDPTSTLHTEHFTVPTGTPPPPPTMGGDGTKAEDLTTRRPLPRRPNFGAPPQASAPNIEPTPSGAFDHYADPATLGEVWCEELASMPPELRGKPPGLFAAWDADLLAAGPVDAEEAIRALAALCRGTPTRAPRVFEWSDLCGQRARYGSAWREALAWRRMGASEPLLGRQHRKATETVPLVGEGAPVPVGLTDRGWT